MNLDDIKWADDSDALKAQASSNQQARGWDTSDGTVTGVPDKPNLQQTNGWMHAVYKWISYLNTLKNPVGTVVQSFLDEATYAAQTDGEWVLCDGRDVSGSTYSQITFQNNVPDARGTIIGGAGVGTNSINGRTPKEIGSLLNVVESKAGISCLTATAEAGKAKWDSTTTVDLDQFEFSGTTSSNDARMEVRTDMITVRTEGDRVLTYDATLFNSPDGALQTAESLSVDHVHLSSTGTISGNLAIEQAKSITTEPVDAVITPAGTNDRDYNVIGDAVVCNFFIRIN